MFKRLLNINCFSQNKIFKILSANILEKFYSCEINCTNIDRSVLFAHHARGCIIIASKICENVVIFQNVTIGSNLRFNKIANQWENVGNPIIGKNTIICDGAKILGPIVIGKNSIIAAGAIVTKDIPDDSIVFNVNEFKPKDNNFDFVFRSDMIASSKIIEANNVLINRYLVDNDC